MQGVDHGVHRAQAIEEGLGDTFFPVVFIELFALFAFVNVTGIHMEQEVSANDNGQNPVACIAQQIHKEIVDPSENDLGFTADGQIGEKDENSHSGAQDEPDKAFGELGFAQSDLIQLLGREVRTQLDGFGSCFCHRRDLLVG